MTLGQRGQAILATLANQPLGRAEVFTRIGLHNDHWAYARHLVPLIEADLVVMTEPDKPTVRTQQYAITDRGRELLAELR